MDRFEQILKDVQEKLNISEIDNNATLATYGIDSLDIVEFILELEEEYNVSFTADETKDIKTMGNLLDLIKSKLN